MPFSSKARLPYLAKPACYFSEEAHLNEVALINRCWQPLPPGDPPTGRPLSSLGSLRWSKVVGPEGSIEAELPPETIMLAKQAFSPRWKLASFFSIAHPCNWKIPIENVLESYHVASLHKNLVARHPELFRVFGGGGDLHHELGDGYSSYFDTFGGRSRLYGRLLTAIHDEATTDYVHHHLFPNLILATTGLFSFVQQVVPIEPRRSQSNIWLYLHAAGGVVDRLPLIRRAAAAAATAAIRRILDEDGAVYESVQRGIESSSRPGAIGTREERIWHFHRYLAQGASRLCSAKGLAEGAEVAGTAIGGSIPRPIATSP